MQPLMNADIDRDKQASASAAGYGATGKTAQRRRDGGVTCMR